MHLIAKGSQSRGRKVCNQVQGFEKDFPLLLILMFYNEALFKAMKNEFCQSKFLLQPLQKNSKGVECPHENPINI